MLTEKKEYNIGLDIGTTSVGWAVVDAETSNIIKKGQDRKALWGVRLFEEAIPAVSRRGYRSTRRRYDRRRKRIKLLQQEFQSEIMKIDPNFYIKLKETYFHEKDTLNKTILLLEEEKKQVKEYYKNYPTIYHLRNKLVENPEKMDIRLVYFAIHHIIKYRGNFLYQNENFSVSNLNIKEKLKEVFESLESYIETFDINKLDYLDYSVLEEALLTIIKSDRKTMLKDSLSDILSKEETTEFSNMLSGYKFSISKLFQLDTETELKTSFKGTEFEDNFDGIEKEIGDKTELLQELKELYDMAFLKELFKNSNSNSLSHLMMERYDNHKDDLECLKRLLRKNRVEYRKIFRSKEKHLCAYDQYMSNSNIDYDYNQFVKNVRLSLSHTLPFLDENELKTLEELKVRIDSGDFMPKITETDNGKYPYQLNKDELLKIIENQGKYYPFLLEKTSDGKYKILALLEFRIPYYVGPLNNTTIKKDIPSKNSWMIRKTKDAITPYNFKNVVDLDKSAEEFILRMISHCSYLLEEPAMPADSILYSKYKVWNELKQIKVNDQRLTVEQQQRIYDNLFLKESKTITETIFKIYLKQDKDFVMYSDFIINGYSAEKRFANSMKSYIDFFGEDGIFKDTGYIEEDADEIIRWITIFEDKEILKRKIQEKYKDLTNIGFKKLMTRKYKGWSNLSKLLLTNKYYYNEETDNHKSILDLLIETNQNFMQIINDKKYNFQKMIDDLNKVDTTKKINYSLVQDLATSPATKRGIYQALKVVEEIVQYMGYRPNQISIEMARSEEEKKRKDSRKEYIEKLYKDCKNEISNYEKLSKELKTIEKIDSQKLFLYFIQEGRSLYSGKSFNIEDLESYEIDHIIPRTLIKDDSIDNKALVFREENQKKAYSFVVPKEYQTDERRMWWNHLKKNKLISSKKMYNLTRSKYDEEDITGFINRQLVETRQITKHVANILNHYYKDTKIIYLHANLSSNYRKKFELFKYRDLNDYHHAHDAYLAAVLGQYTESHLKNVNYELVKELNQLFYEKKEYQKLNYGYAINSLDNLLTHYDKKTGELTFNPNQLNIMVEKTLGRNDIFISKKTEIRTGEFYNQTIYPKKTKGISLREKLSTDYYGVYSGINPSYAICIRYSNGKKEIQKLIGIPIYIDQISKAKPGKREEYIRTLLNLKETDSIEIIKDKIPFYSRINWDGKQCLLVGATDTVEVCNAKQFYFDKVHMNLWKYSLNRLLNKVKKSQEDDLLYEKQLDEIMNYVIEKVEKEYLLYKNQFQSLLSTININNLNLEEKEKLIIEFLKLLKCNSTTANLKFINQSTAFCRMHHRTISTGLIINQSVTGIWGKEYEF